MLLCAVRLLLPGLGCQRSSDLQHGQALLILPAGNAPCAQCGPTAPRPPPPQVRECLLAEAKRLFKRVRLVPTSQLPRPLRLEYCDLWELSQPLRLEPAGAAGGKGAGRARDRGGKQ